MDTVFIFGQMGALTSLRSGMVNPHDGELTFLGRILATLPVDIHLGKLIVMGHVFGMLEECLTIGMFKLFRFIKLHVINLIEINLSSCVQVLQFQEY